MRLFKVCFLEENMNKVITVGREFGSGGRELARRLAAELGYAYYDSEVLTAIVDHTELSESYVKEIVEGKSYRLFPITIEHTLSASYDYNIKRIQEIYSAQTEVIREMSQKSSCVIVGRCADFILREVENIELYRIFVYADFEARLERCKDRAPEGETLTEKDIRKMIQKIDKARANYYEDYTLQRWGDKQYYDLCINTGNIDIEEFVPHFAKFFM